MLLEEDRKDLLVHLKEELMNNNPEEYVVNIFYSDGSVDTVKGININGIIFCKDGLILSSSKSQDKMFILYDSVRSFDLIHLR